MANKVFANGREISCKAASGKTICAMPDVCFTPPENPATPPGVPIPYPNTGMASDTTDGSKSVKISGKEVGIKNKSCFKKSMGDEAGCAAKKGVITSKNMGKVYFKSWSMDVKIEGKNAVRHLDMTTNNHASEPGDTPPWPYMDSMAMADSDHPCAKSGDKKKVADNCTKTEKPEDDCTEPCKSARKCMMVGFPKGNKSSKQYENTNKCCDGKTAHHAIPFAEFAAMRPNRSGRGTPQVGNYNEHDAPCMCLDGRDHNKEKTGPLKGTLKEHARAGRAFALARDIALSDPETKKVPPPGTEYPYEVASNAAANSLAEVTGCDADCLKRQIDDGHKKMDVPATAKLRKSHQFGGGTKNVKKARAV